MIAKTPKRFSTQFKRQLDILPQAIGAPIRAARAEKLIRRIQTLCGAWEFCSIFHALSSGQGQLV